jgi:hypothetical protein
VFAERSREPLSLRFLREPGEATLEHRPYAIMSLTGAREGAETTAGGQFGWGGTPLKRYQGGPKIGSGGTETRRRVQGQKPV